MNRSQNESERRKWWRIAIFGIMCLELTLGCRPALPSGPPADPPGSKSEASIKETSHPLEQRKKDLADLLVEFEAGKTFDKQAVRARMGKPDKVRTTGSKEYSNRLILTCYDYALEPGEYVLPETRFTLKSKKWKVSFSFDERTNHGRKGRLYDVIDDHVPLESVSFYDEDRMHNLTDDKDVIISFPIRDRYRMP